MKPYTLEEVLELPDGAEVWVETRARFWSGSEGPMWRKTFHDNLGKIIHGVDRDNAFWDLNGPSFANFYRVWPSRPTDAERAATGWEVQ